MRIKTLTFLLFIASLSLSACGGGSTIPASDMNAVQTIAAATFQAMTEHPSTEANTPLPTAEDVATADTPQATEVPPTAIVAANTALPTVLVPSSPVTVYPRGSFVPFSATECELLRIAFQDALGQPFVIESAPFTDWVSGGAGTACRIHGVGNATVYSMDALTTLRNLLPNRGWTEDMQYGAAGATGMGTGFTKAGAIGLLSVGWRPSADANCPKDQPISMCPLTPQQKLYDVTYDVADVVVYNPPSASDCNTWLNAIQKALPVTAVLETVNFTDLEWYTGAACQARAVGTGVTFTNIVDVAQAIDAVLAPFGWTIVNGADGPTGTAREYTYGTNLVGVIHVKWEPAPGYSCPQDQPIGMCNLTPEQRLYTVTAALAEK